MKKEMSPITLHVNKSGEKIGVDIDLGILKIIKNILYFFFWLFVLSLFATFGIYGIPLFLGFLLLFFTVRHRMKGKTQKEETTNEKLSYTKGFVALYIAISIGLIGVGAATYFFLREETGYEETERVETERVTIHSPIAYGTFDQGEPGVSDAEIAIGYSFYSASTCNRLPPAVEYDIQRQGNTLLIDVLGHFIERPKNQRLSDTYACGHTSNSRFYEVKAPLTGIDSLEEVIIILDEKKNRYTVENGSRLRPAGVVNAFLYSEAVDRHNPATYVLVDEYCDRAGAWYIDNCHALSVLAGIGRWKRY